LFDYSKLCGRIVEKCGTKRNFVERLGISYHTFVTRLNGNSGFTQAEMVEIANILDFSLEEIPIYFFNAKT